MNVNPFLILSFVFSLTGSINPAWAANTPLKTGMDIKDEKKIQVNSVKIENFAGSVIINSTGTGKDVSVSLKGDEALLNQVGVKEDNNELHIAFNKDAPIVKDMDSFNLTVNMPATMPLDLEIFGGKAVVAKRESHDTRLNINGFGDIRADYVKNLESVISGSGEMTVKKIEGNAKLRIEGDGKYNIEQGTIPFLNAKIQGTGLIIINAEIKDADLNSEGAGTMRLAQVDGKLLQTTSGAGTITVHKISGSLKNRTLPPRKKLHKRSE
jgi:hypothetical protein